MHSLRCAGARRAKDAGGYGGWCGHSESAVVRLQLMRANLRIRESASGPQCSFTAVSASDDARFTRSIVCRAFHRIATTPNADHSTIDVSRRTPVRIAATIALPHIFFDR
ncbi:hypothetical protein [Burkholderia multivorans]|uniref:hypothetical protein n=1 Tax=Burkholderia multivorans TaxID=87883 RepID=UPI0018728BCB|nr:hypothetical protein [Burkholderia multivorans]MBJ9654764.1 hypothetical protein [Burkholderia multivorans]MBU9280890.1 hypothetical protein [Burkholderia multivorans]MBU9471251.1 hypothetical protein [Burkholderia multivorans]